MLWHLMREAAIARHLWVWKLFEGARGDRWPAHMTVVRAVYGY